MLASQPKISRRDLLIKGSVLSITSVALLAGLNVKALAGDRGQATQQDIDVLNEILGTEHEGIAAYQICLDGGLLQKSVGKTAKLFRDHHKAHRDILVKSISDLGGTPVLAKSQIDYVNDLDISLLKSQNDALQLIAKLERGAANAYIGMMPSTNDHELVKVAGRIAADEVIHWTTLLALLHIPVPTEALSFGA